MKLKVGIIFGGESTEHDVSIQSSQGVIQNLSREKYDLDAIYIDKNGSWYKILDISDINIKHIRLIEDIFTYLKKFDVIFPVLHGKYGEDGTIQGLLELLHIPYVGCGVLASSIAMDKVYTKYIMKHAGIKQSNYVYVRKELDQYNFIDDDFSCVKDTLDGICKMIENKLEYPMFVKPSNSGSSIGIRKVFNSDELINAIDKASFYDSKIIIEENVVGREIECAVLGNYDVKASCLGEIKPAGDFYTYAAKYDNSDSKLIIPADISSDLSDKVRSVAIRAFRAIDGRGLARVDFFVNDITKEVYVNEINTLPGFTNISMYPKLWENDGLKYNELLDRLIELALER